MSHAMDLNALDLHGIAAGLSNGEFSSLDLVNVRSSYASVCRYPQKSNQRTLRRLTSIESPRSMAS